MRKKSFWKFNRLRFTCFSRKNYALFSCVGREVIIGTLSVATLTQTKAEGVSVRTDAVGDSLQHNELRLDEVVVTGSRVPLTLCESAKIVSVITREDIHRAAAETISDVLKSVTGVDVRQRGGFGVQTDISIRGGNFDQITILINGVSVSSPQTGHLSADFPVSMEDIERIEILEGPAARVYGTSAFNGVINIITRQSGNEALAHLYGGGYGYAGGNGSVSIDAAGLGNNGAGRFRSMLSGGYTRADGATPNSGFSSTRLFYNGGFSADNFSVSGQAGYSYKPYSANTFYGAASTDQWESNERWMLALSGNVKVGKVHIAPQLYWNRWYDHYQWHKGEPAGENFHKVDSRGVSANAWTTTVAGRTSLGIEMREESVLSTSLGEQLAEGEWQETGGHDAEKGIYYKCKASRTNVSAFMEHDILLDRWTFSLGLLANMNSGNDHRWRFYPGMDVAWRPDSRWRLYASWNMALRMPTFTDLYYSGKNIEGNRNIRPEKTSDLQLGAAFSAKGVAVEAQAFYSHKTDMIDWVTFSAPSATGEPESDGIFHSVNFQLDNVGAEMNVRFLPQQLWGGAFPLTSVGLQYAYINESPSYTVNVISSKYAMEYLRHKLVLSASGRLWKNLSLSLSWRWQDRVGESNPSYALLDGRLSWNERRWRLYVDGENLFNKRYYDYVTIPQPGRWLRAGLTVSLWRK